LSAPHLRFFFLLPFLSKQPRDDFAISNILGYHRPVPHTRRHFVPRHFQPPSPQQAKRTGPLHRHQGRSQLQPMPGCKKKQVLNAKCQPNYACFDGARLDACLV
jgi:hypothetical protein